MQHYLCDGCGAFFKEPGSCRNPNCPNYNKELRECFCGDSSAHEGTQEDENEEEVVYSVPLEEEEEDEEEYYN